MGGTFLPPSTKIPRWRVGLVDATKGPRWRVGFVWEEGATEGTEDTEGRSFLGWFFWGRVCHCLACPAVSVRGALAVMLWRLALVEYRLVCRSARTPNKNLPTIDGLLCRMAGSTVSLMQRTALLDKPDSGKRRLSPRWGLRGMGANPRTRGSRHLAIDERRFAAGRTNHGRPL